MEVVNLLNESAARAPGDDAIILHRENLSLVKGEYNLTPPRGENYS